MRLALGALAGIAVATMGCAGGGPLLHPAKTLAKGDVRALAGVSANAAEAGLGDGLRDARNAAAAQPGTTNTPTYAKGALVAAAVAPGVAPVLAARVGLGSQLEGGLTYTARSVRVDARRAFLLDDKAHWALSLGAGGTAALYGRQQGSTLPGVDLSSLKGWGLDAPVLVGYESDGGLYMAWLGARGGWEHDTIEQVTSEPIPGSPPATLTADRYWAGGVLGAAAGFRHVHVAVELDAQYESVTGSFEGVDATVAGFVLVPAGAVWWDF